MSVVLPAPFGPRTATRSPGFMRSPAALERLLGLGALTQLTSTAFSGRFGDTVRKVAFEMLERGHGHVIASDGHGADGRPPDLLCALEAFERRYEDPRELFDWMTVGVPGAIVAGEHDCVEPLAGSFHLPQGVKHVRFAKFDVGCLVKLGVFDGRLYCFSCDIDAQDTVANSGEVKSKRS